MNELNKTDLFRALETLKPIDEMKKELEAQAQATTEAITQRLKREEKRADEAEARAEREKERADKAEKSPPWLGDLKGAIQEEGGKTREEVQGQGSRIERAVLQTEAAAKGRRVERIADAGLVQVFQLVEKKKKELGGDDFAARGEAMQEGKEKGWLPENTNPETFRKKLGKWRSWGRPDGDGFEKRWKAMKRAEKPKRKTKKKG